MFELGWILVFGGSITVFVTYFLMYAALSLNSRGIWFISTVLIGVFAEWPVAKVPFLAFVGGILAMIAGYQIGW